MRDNLHTSPSIILAQALAGPNQDRLSVELALITQQTVNADETSQTATASTSIGGGSVIFSGGGGGGGGGGRFPCFTGETVIHAPEPFKIREAKFGQEVYAFNDKREIGIYLIQDVFVHEVLEFLRVETASTILNVTPEHLIYDGTGFKPIEEFEIGEAVFSADFTPLPITNTYRVSLNKPIPVFNLKTETRTYFANGVAVHNLKAPSDV